MAFLFAPADPSSSPIRRHALSINPVFALGCLFVALRLIHLDSTYVQGDDWFTLGTLRGLDWPNLLPATVDYVSTMITGPFLPTLLDRVLIKLFGPNLVILRLPSLLTALGGFYLLHRILERLFTSPAARLFPLVLFTFSVPSIIYAQQIQPSIYYFFTTVLQVFVFLKLLPRDNAPPDFGRMVRDLLILAQTTVACFLLNYMSLLIFGLLTGIYVLRALFQSEAARARLAVLFKGAGIALFAALPLAILALLRILSGSEHQGLVRDYLHRFYIDTPSDIPPLVYDFLAYHFNFAYDQALYTQMGANWLSLPFVLLCLFGGVVYCWGGIRRLAYLGFGLALLFVAVRVRMMPFGGLRHTFTIVPFVYLLLAGAVDHFAKPGNGSGQARKKTALAVVAGFCLFMLALFLVSGSSLYSKRNTRVDLETLVALAGETGARTVLLYEDSIAAIYMHNLTQGDVLGKAGISLATFTPEVNKAFQGPYLLATQYYLINPGPEWRWAHWRVDIPLESFDHKAVTPLVQDNGGVDVRTMGMQTIYSPVNGFYVYLVRPADP